LAANSAGEAGTISIN